MPCNGASMQKFFDACTQDNGTNKRKFRGEYYIFNNQLNSKIRGDKSSYYVIR